MTTRPKTTERPKAGGASAPAWIGALILAAGGFAGSWLSYQAGSDAAGVRLGALERRVGQLETKTNKDHDALIRLEANNHSHNRGRK